MSKTILKTVPGFTELIFISLSGTSFLCVPAVSNYSEFLNLFLCTAAVAFTASASFIWGAYTTIKLGPRLSQILEIVKFPKG